MTKYKNIISHQHLIDKFYIALYNLDFTNYESNDFNVKANEILLLTAVSENPCRWDVHHNYYYFEFTFVSVESFKEQKLKLYCNYSDLVRDPDDRIRKHIYSNLDFFEEHFKKI